MSTPPQVPGYRIEGPIGFGSEGTLWLGRDESGTARAIRVLEALPPGRQQARLRRLNALTGIRHPNLAPVLEVIPLDGEGHAVISVAVPGPTLATVRAGRAGLTRAEAVGVLQDLCTGLSALHVEGLGHGDIAPGNVLISPEADGDSSAILIDLTGESAFEGGTAGFAAPEVGTGSAAVLPADVFSLASLAVWMVRESDREELERRLRPALAAEPGERPAIGELSALIGSDWTRPVALPGAGSLAGASLREHAQRDFTRRKAASRARHRRPRRLVTGPRLIGVGVFSVLLAVGLVLSPLGPGRMSQPDPGTQSSTVTQTGPATTASAESAEPGHDAAAEVISAVLNLTAARDDALNAGDPDALATVSQRQSPAQESDLALLRTFQQAQVQVQDLRTEVIDVEVTDLGAETARVSVRLHQKPYQQISADGVEVTVPATRSCAVLALEHSGQGWQVTTTQAC